MILISQQTKPLDSDMGVQDTVSNVQERDPHLPQRAHLWAGPVGQRAGRTLSLACGGSPCLTFSQAVKEPSYLKGTYYSLKLACVALPWTSFSASMHYMNHSIKCNLSSKCDWKTEEQNFKKPQKNSMAGLGCLLLYLHFSPTPFSSAFPGLFHQTIIQKKVTQNYHFRDQFDGSSKPWFPPSPRIRYTQAFET